MKHDLINLSTAIPGIAIELIYSTKENFTGSPVYPVDAKVYLCRSPALRLKAVQEALQKKGLSLKIWDGYRPLSVQKIFWARVPDPRYVGNPATGSKHNRGAAVDLTLIDENGVELPMQSAFDDFSHRAHRDYADCDPVHLKNVQILTAAMTQAGFLSAATEWWHFEDPDWANYPILDISFAELP